MLFTVDSYFSLVTEMAGAANSDLLPFFIPHEEYGKPVFMINISYL